MINKYKFYLMWIMAFVVLVTIGTCKIAQTEEIPQIVFINGVENGICLVPNVNLWNKPGRTLAGTRVISTVKGCVGLPVKIIEVKLVKSRMWYHVKTFGANTGKSGWLLDSLIRH
jgi:hypothetical protein